MAKRIPRLLYLAALAIGLIVSKVNAKCNNTCLMNAKIIPQFACNNTCAGLKVVYSGNSSMDCGNKMNLMVTKDPPVVTYDLKKQCSTASIIMFVLRKEFCTSVVKYPPDVTYDLKKQCSTASIIMFDPDAPMNPSYLHWFVANIPKKDLKKGFNGSSEASGDTISNYVMPGAPTGDHRYTICVYCQTRQITEAHKPKTEFGFKYNPKCYPKRVGLGNPIACNFMKAALSSMQPDSPFKSSPTLVKTPNT